jgi:hypothetical protein
LALPSIWNGKNCLSCFFSCWELYCIGGLLCHPTCYQSVLAAGISNLLFLNTIFKISHINHCHHGALVIHVILWCFGLILYYLCHSSFFWCTMYAVDSAWILGQANLSSAWILEQTNWSMFFFKKNCIGLIIGASEVKR